MQYKLTVYDENGIIITSGVSSVTFTATPTSVFNTSVSVEAGIAAVELEMDNQAANTVLAGPITGSDAQPTFRALVADDLGTLFVSPPDIGTTTPAKGWFSELKIKIGGFFATITHAMSSDRTITLPDANTTLVGRDTTDTLTNKTLTTPIIGDLTNATHTHQNNAGGGTLDAAAIATGTLNNSRVNFAAPADIGGTTPAKGYFSDLREKIGGFFAIFTHANSADRTYTLPNATGTIALTSDLADGVITPFTLLGADGTISLSPPNTYKHLELLIFARSDRAAQTVDGLKITFNNDTGSNYGVLQQNITQAGALTATFSDADNKIQAALIPAASSTASYFGAARILILNYNDAANYKQVIVQYGNARSTTLYDTGMAFAQYKSSSAISSIQIGVVNGTNLKQNTGYELRGLN